MKPIALIALVLVIVGALNWGLWAALKFDLVAAILGDYSIASRVVYGLVGVSALVVAAQIPAFARAK